MAPPITDLEPSEMDENQEEDMDQEEDKEQDESVAIKFMKPAAIWIH